jgi:signal transduction histidine kinase
MIRRSPSLFITFGIAFFAVLLLAFLAHQLFLSDLIRSLLIGWERDRVEVVAEAARDELAARYSELDDAGIEEVLRRHASEIRGLHLVLWRQGKSPLANHAMPPMMRHGLRRRLEDPDLQDRMHPPRLGRRWLLEMPDLKEHVEVISRIDLVGEGDQVEQLVAILPPGLSRPALDQHPNPRLLLLLLPMALLLAGLAGLVVFRLLTRRLQALETLAERVSEGDLGVRVQDLGRDEIGRLGSRLNEMTANLSRARKTIADNDRGRRQLLADISHELATPLTSIRGYTETLLNPEVPVSEEERTRYLELVSEESQRMDALIDDVLELSRLESGSIPLQREHLDWMALCRNILHRYRERFATAGLALELAGQDEGLAEGEIPTADVALPAGERVTAGGVPEAGEAPGVGEVWIDADGRRMEQVIDNLLANALRYVPSGGRVEVALQAQADGTARLAVSDNGEGFSEQDLPHVFDRFYRADAARSSEGSGLGLAIVHEIVCQHGGRITARNRATGGAVIEIILPTV